MSSINIKNSGDGSLNKYIKAVLILVKNINPSINPNEFQGALASIFRLAEANSQSTQDNGKTFAEFLMFLHTHKLWPEEVPKENYSLWYFDNKKRL